MHRPRVPTVAVIVVATALLSLLALLHDSDLHTHVHAHIAHHRALQQIISTPSLRLLFHGKRDSMKIHGHTDFELLVQPCTALTTNKDVFEFNGVASFVDGDTTHTYKLVDGVAYYIRQQQLSTADTAVNTPLVQRLPASSLPPVHELLEALAAATPIDAVDTTQAIDCPPTSRLFHARFSSQDFVLCGFESTGVRVFGEDFDVEISVSPTSMTITTSEEQLQSTDTISGDVVTSATHPDIVPASTLRASPTSDIDAIQRATADLVVRALAPQTLRRLPLQAASCGCRNTPRPCIFFHGMDIKADGGLVDDFDFFGDIKKHAPCCSSIKFAVLNTVDYAWNNASLVEKACGYALAMSPQSDNATRTIENTIVVSHSMGNLMLAHAEATGKCTLGKTSSWVALSGPFKGSMGSDFQQQVCTGDYFGKDVVAAVVALFGQCPQSKARQALYYQGGNFSSPELTAQFTAARKIHEKRVTAGVCGFSYNGLVSGDSVGLFLGGTILPHKSKENDGVVEFQSCIGDQSARLFGENWSNQFYRAKLNHADTTLKHGDAWFDNRRKPVKWFECLPL